MVTTEIAPIQSLTAHEHPVRLIVFGPNGLMATADTNIQVVVWKDQQVVCNMDERVTNQRHRAIDRLRSAAFSLDGGALYLACGSRLKSADPKTGRSLWKYVAPEWWPFMIA